MIILGLDYGRRRTGVAIGNLATYTARPLQVVEGDGERRLLALERIATEWRPSRIIAGLPVHMDGTPHRATERARDFAERVAGRLGLPLEFADERLTTAEARRENPGMKNVDAEAAAIILRDWLRKKEKS